MYFQYMIYIVEYKKMSTPGTVPKHCLGFSYILLEEYELDQNFDETSFLKTIRPHIQR